MSDRKPLQVDPPIALLAELSHRCPLRCGYCSNPLELTRTSAELGTDDWCRTLQEAAELGVLQVHFSGGEPSVRQDLERLVSHARRHDLYTNLITSGVLLDARRIDDLYEAGLDHLQLSVQGRDAQGADLIGGYPGGHEKKLAVAALVRERGIMLTLNAVVHRRNLHEVDALIDLAMELDAHRIEIACVQYNGWARRNLAALLPTPEQVEDLMKTIEAARARVLGHIAIDFVPPDYYAERPKPCMHGWGQQIITVNPAGLVLPCHSAETIPGMVFDSVTHRSLADIWYRGEAFGRFRGTDWMQEPCRSCEFREQDFGGCRCQALAIAGDVSAADPVCEKSPDRAKVDALIAAAQAEPDAPYLYRGESIGVNRSG